MTANQKVTGTASTMAGGLALGGGISLAVTLAGAWIFAMFISNETIPESGAGYCAMGIIVFSALAGALTAAGRIKRRLVYVCGASGGIYYGLLLSITALFFGGQYTGMGVTALLVLGSSTAAALLLTRRGGDHRRRKKRRR